MSLFLRKNSANGIVIVTTDGGSGSSGKGLLNQYLATQAGIQWDVATCNFMPNAGHTVTLADGSRIMTQQLPSSFLNPNVILAINAGAAIEVPLFLAEIDRLEALGYDIKSRLTIHPNAAIITEAEKDTERQLLKSGSTFKGCGAAIAKKVMRLGLRACEVDELAQYIDHDYQNRMIKLVEQGANILIEGAQGVDLDLNHGQYPYCLHPKSKIQMADDSVKDIGDITVGDKVVSLDMLTGVRVVKSVINTWVKKNPEKTLFKIETVSSEFNGRGSLSGAGYTGDHRIRTANRGVLRVSELVAGDLIFSGESKITGSALQVFLGSMLGDGTVPAVKKSPKRGQFSFGHSIRQLRYLQAKAEVVNKLLPGSIREIATNAGSFQTDAFHYRFESVYSREVRELAEHYGCFGAKSPNIARIVDHIDPRGLAIWYQDDGILQYKRGWTSEAPYQKCNVTLYTNGFELGCQLELIAALEAKFGLNFSIDSIKAGPLRRSYNILRLSRLDNEKWFNLIRPFTHEDLSYKVIGDTDWSFNDDTPEPATEAIVSIREYTPTRCRADVVDIEVEDTHNFFAKNGKGWINVENCTSRQTTPAALVTDAGIPFNLISGVILNWRTHPIRISNESAADGSDRYSGDCFGAPEIDWSTVAIEGGFTPEEFNELYLPSLKTTVTKKIRRVFRFPKDRADYVFRLCGGSGFVQNSLNFLNWVDRDSDGVTEKVESWLTDNWSPQMRNALALVRWGERPDQVGPV